MEQAARHHLHGHGLLIVLVGAFGEVHGAHAAAAEQCRDPVVANHGARPDLQDRDRQGSVRGVLHRLGVPEASRLAGGDGKATEYRDPVTLQLCN